MVEDGRKTNLRWLLLGVVLCVAIAPTLPLVISALKQPASGPLWTKAFSDSLLSSLWLGIGVSLLSFLIGLPLGLVAVVSAVHRLEQPFRVQLAGVVAGTQRVLRLRVRTWSTNGAFAVFHSLGGVSESDRFSN
jgi:ABC-type uncharacterized transport system permease subunit